MFYDFIDSEEKQRDAKQAKKAEELLADMRRLFIEIDTQKAGKLDKTNLKKYFKLL